MAYLISRQRAAFEGQIESIKTKLGAADRPDLSVDLRDYAVAAAIFLAHAEFENYFVYVLSDIARTYTLAASDATKLPAKLRVHLVVTKFNLEGLAPKLLSRARDPDFTNAIEKWFNSADRSLIAGAGSLAPLSGIDIYGDYSYPSMQNIERILRRLGVGDVRGTLNRLGGGRDVVALLESIADLRTSLAHSAQLPGINISDVLLRIDGLKVFAQAFDRTLHAQILTTLTVQDWQTQMC